MILVALEICTVVVISAVCLFLVVKVISRAWVIAEEAWTEIEEEQETRRVRREVKEAMADSND